MKNEEIKLVDFNNVDLNFLEDILKNVPSNIFFKDVECRYIFATHYWRHLDIDEQDENWDIKGKTDLEIRKDKENAMYAYEMDKKILETGVGVNYVIKIEQDGIIEYLELIKNPVRDKDGKIIGIVGLINDVTERILLEQKLEDLANKDQLTKLYNRCYLNNWLEKENNESLYPLSIILADCNGLKHINDTYGHLTGDKYIIESANTIIASVPSNAKIFRIGGDEFLVIIPNTEEVEINKYKEKILNKCKNTPFENGNLSIAVGSVTIKNFKSDLSKYIESADEAMYKNKIIMKENEKEV